MLCLLGAALSSSVQGPIAAAAGLFVVALAWVLDQHGARLKVDLTVLLAGVTVAGGSLLVGALAAAGPAASIFGDSGSRARVFYWEAALAMFSDHPLWGVGLDQHGNFWRSERSASSVDFLGGPSYSDADHSVPLQMLAQGGLVLGLLYAAFLVLTATAVVRGLIRLRGADRMLLTAVGAGWTAYQVQSFVTRKITSTAAAISEGRASELVLGNLDARRDWGWAPEYVDALVRMARHDDADDYVVATGRSHSVRDFVAVAFQHVGINDWERYIRSDPAFVRPVDAGELVGDASLAAATLDWQAHTDFVDLVGRMVDADGRHPAR